MADLAGGQAPRRPPNRRAEWALLAIGAVLVLVVALVGVVQLGGDSGEEGDGAAGAVETPTGPEPAVTGYYERWSAYEDESDYFLTDLVESGAADRLRRLVYTLGTGTEQGECTSGDPWADYQWPIPADRSIDGEADTEDQPLAGHFNQLRKLKQRYPDLSITIAIGSEAAGDDFQSIVGTPEDRQAFVADCVDTFLRGNLRVLDDLPQGGEGVAEGIFDGIEVHWQWPDEVDRESHTALLAELRRQFDEYGTQIGRHFSVSTLLPAYAESLEGSYDLPELFEYVDYATIEGFYFYAPWNDDNLVTNHHAQLHSPPGNPYTQWGYEKSVAGGVALLLDAGVPAERLVVGMPAFGPGWEGVPEADGGLYQTGTGGGFYTYDDINAAPGTTEIDQDAVAAYRYDGDVWYSYDTPETIATKTTYAREQGLGGVAIWPLSGDRDADLVTAAAGAWR